jgi:hypothetical protein
MMHKQNIMLVMFEIAFLELQSCVKLVYSGLTSKHSNGSIHKKRLVLFAERRLRLKNNVPMKKLKIARQKL